jgi:hypothetical protein
VAAEARLLPDGKSGGRDRDEGKYPSDDRGRGRDRDEPRKGRDTSTSAPAKQDDFDDDIPF